MAAVLLEWNSALFKQHSGKQPSKQFKYYFFLSEVLIANSLLKSVKFIDDQSQCVPSSTNVLT